MAEERILVQRAILVTGGTGIAQRAVAELDADKEPWRRVQFDAPTKFVIQKRAISELT